MMIALVWKATALLVVALVAVRVARHTRASVRHAILVAAFAVLAVLPIALIAMPAIDMPLLPVGSTEPGLADALPANAEGRARDLATAADSALPAGPGFPAPIEHTRAEWSPGLLASRPGMLLAVLWAMGAAAILLSVVIGVMRVQRLRRSAIPYLGARPLLASLVASANVRTPVDLVTHEAMGAPITCGLWRTSIVVPGDIDEWTEAALSRALVHELEHVRRRDWATQVAARAICALYWFHPLVWMAYRQLCLEAEHACDDAVIAKEESTTYADQLVQLARRMAAQPAVAMLGMAHRSDLAARVTAVLDANQARGRAGAMRAILIASGAAALLLTIAPLQIVEAEASTSASAPDAATPASAANTATSITGDQPSSSANQGMRVGALAPTSPASEQRRGSTSRLDQALVEAAAEGDLDDVREILGAGTNVNAAVLGDGTALIGAARGGHMAIVRLLLERGADVNQAVPGDGAPLIMAAREGHLAIVQLLLDHGADVEQMVDGDENALIQASGAGHLDVVRLLVERGANVNARAFARGYGLRDDEWRTPLTMAVNGGHRAVVDFLRAHGALE